MVEVMREPSASRPDALDGFFQVPLVHLDADKVQPMASSEPLGKPAEQVEAVAKIERNVARPISKLVC